MSRLMVGLVVGCVGLSAAADDKPDAAAALKKDLEVVQGKWVRAATTEEGMLGAATSAVKEVSGDTETVTWTDDAGEVVRRHTNRFKLSADGPVRVWTFSDIEILDGPGKGMKRAGRVGAFVYRVSGDELAEAGGVTADSRGRSNLSLWRRPAPPASAPVALTEEQKANQGVWTFFSQEGRGMKFTAENYKRTTLTIEGNRFVVRHGKAVIQAGTATWDLTKSPRWVDVTVTEGDSRGDKWLGIFEQVDADTVRICVDPEGKKRPTDFKTGLLLPYFMNVHKRVKP